MSDQSEITRLARPEILALKAYSSARSLVDPDASLTFLDANESPYPHEDGWTLNRYPEPQPRELVRRFADLYDTPPDSLVVTRGSDEAIDLLVRAFCREGRDSILICPPTYGVYEIAAQIQGAATVRVPMLFAKAGMPELDERGIIEALRQGTRDPGAGLKLVFVCNPNNPTGTQFERAQLERLCAASARSALVVVDEAYSEFTGTRSMIDNIPKYPNLVVLRTLSKAWALAGARCGVAVASPAIIALLQKVRAPYPLPAPASDVALAALDPAGQAAMKERVKHILQARDWLGAELRKVAGVTEVFNTAANFVLVRFKDAPAMMRAARAAGIVIRDRSGEPGLAGCIRITVGTPVENEALIKALKGAVS